MPIKVLFVLSLGVAPNPAAYLKYRIHTTFIVTMKVRRRMTDIVYNVNPTSVLGSFGAISFPLSKREWIEMN